MSGTAGPSDLWAETCAAVLGLSRSGLLRKLKRMVLWLLLVYVSVPFIIKMCPSIQAKLVFLNFGVFPASLSS